MQELIDNFQKQFAQQASLDNAIGSLRQEGIKRLEQIGFPTTADENWRYTNLKSVLKQPYAVVNQADAKLNQQQIDQFAIAALDSLQLVFIDGQLSAEHSASTLPEGLLIEPLEQMIQKDSARVSAHLDQLLPQQAHGFMALNTAFVSGGAWIEIAENAQIDQAIELLFISTAKADALVQPRNIVIALENSNAKLIERYVTLDGAEKNMTNSMIELFCHAQSTLEHVRVQQESRATNHISGTFAKLDAKAHFSTSTITLGGNLTRNDLRCQIAGKNAHCNMYGLYAANQRQHVDNFTHVEHQVAECTSDELYKGVLDDRARAVFHGRIYVAQDAQQTDAFQNNRTLLLSRDAEIDTKPQLEIYADDVKCSHGATIGQLNKEYLFYLRARGVAQDKARRMLTFAFVKEALGAISIEPLVAYLETQLDEQLQAGGHYGAE